MKNPDQIPITPLDPTATLPQVISAVNKIIESVNFMWDAEEEDAV